jgi:phosphoribosylamine--glycine ligase
MNILILGSGGREHALAWKISQSNLCSNLFIAPGNAGTASCGKNILIDVNDFHAIKETVIKYLIGLVVVGPEEPLVKGITDFFKTDTELKKILIIGPGKEGARLEGSKDFAKKFMKRYGIPTADYETFSKDQLSSAVEYMSRISPPHVLKADGLAAGKGVIISSSLDDSKQQIKNLFSNSKFGTAADKIVIEEFLDGIELSVFIITDGKSYKILPEAKDYKRIGDHDEGPNTGGMGAVSPLAFADQAFMKKVEERIIQPTIEGLQKEKIPYCGFIFIGLMNVKGDPYVIEYNVRMGDPETEVVIPRIKSDLVDLFVKAATGELDKIKLNVTDDTAVTVMMVSGGYPDNYEKGKSISIEKVEYDSIIFHAGTKESDGKLLTNGGRVLSITSFGKNIDEARKKSYHQIDKIKFDKNYYRKDIGLDLIKVDA